MTKMIGMVWLCLISYVLLYQCELKISSHNDSIENVEYDNLNEHFVNLNAKNNDGIFVFECFSNDRVIISLKSDDDNNNTNSDDLVILMIIDSIDSYSNIQSDMHQMLDLKEYDLTKYTFLIPVKKQLRNLLSYINIISTLDANIGTYVGGNALITETDCRLEVYKIPSPLPSSNTVSSFDLGYCEFLLRNSLSLSSSNDLIIAKFDVDRIGSISPQFEYTVYHAPNTRLSLTLCNGYNITYAMPITDKTLLSSYVIAKKIYIDHHVDIFNPFDPLFNDPCVYFNPDNTDMILKDRRKYYYQPHPLCEANCDYQRIDYDTNKVICKCPIKTSLSTVTIPNVNTPILARLNDSYFTVVRCLGILMDWRRFKSNYGMLVFVSLIFIQSITIIIFLLCGMPYLNKLLQATKTKEKVVYLSKKYWEEGKNFINYFARNNLTDLETKLELAKERFFDVDSFINFCFNSKIAHPISLLDKGEFQIELDEDDEEEEDKKAYLEDGENKEGMEQEKKDFLEKKHQLLLKETNHYYPFHNISLAKEESKSDYYPFISKNQKKNDENLKFYSPKIKEEQKLIESRNYANKIRNCININTTSLKEDDTERTLQNNKAVMKDERTLLNNKTEMKIDIIEEENYFTKKKIEDEKTVVNQTNDEIEYKDVICEKPTLAIIPSIENADLNENPIELENNDIEGEKKEEVALDNIEKKPEDKPNEEEKRAQDKPIEEKKPEDKSIEGDKQQEEIIEIKPKIEPLDLTCGKRKKLVALTMKEYHERKDKHEEIEAYKKLRAELDKKIKIRNEDDTKYQESSKINLYKDYLLDYAIVHDKRGFWGLLWYTFTEREIFSRIFITKSRYELKSVKLFLFIFNISLDLFFNTLFYSDELISQKFYNQGNLPFLPLIIKSILSSCAAWVINLFARWIVAYENYFEVLSNELIRDEKFKDYTERFLQVIQKKMMTHFIIEQILMVFFFYYVTAFCGIFPNSQASMFIGFGVSLLFEFCVILLMSIIVSFIRCCGLKYKNKKAYYTGIFLKNRL